MNGQMADQSVVGSMAAEAASGPSQALLEIFNSYIFVFLVSFVVTVSVTPLLRRLAIANGIVDRPNDPRKAHKLPVAYLGGVAVYIGVLAGIAFSFVGVALLPESVFSFHQSQFLDPDIQNEGFRIVPMSIILGMTLIAVTGLIDDVVGLDPRLKIVGQLLAAAALAMQDVGTKVASGVMQPIGRLVGNEDMVYMIPMPTEIPFLAPTGSIEVDVIYWVGTAIIAIFVLGACNASNLIDGLDGLLSGVTAIAAAGLLVMALLLAQSDDGSLDAARVILALALLGGCLGFLPHNFNPATIFLGDCGSLLLGYLTIVLVLSMGDTGRTHLVVAGLIIYAIPIIDTALAIVRRKLAGKPMSVADDQHLHHQLKRAFGVKGAVLTLYGIGAVFAGLGVWLSEGRVRVVFTIAIVFAAFIGVTAVKIARRQAIEDDTVRRFSGGAAKAESESASRRPAGEPASARADHAESPASV
jgi:UDP-GlcNAc:undecaprenyl-phosphate GlcNAc-1-phosphate transferase